MTTDRQVEAITPLQCDSTEHSERVSITGSTVQSTQDKVDMNEQTIMDLQATIMQLQNEVRATPHERGTNGFTPLVVKLLFEACALSLEPMIHYKTYVSNTTTIYLTWSRRFPTHRTLLVSRVWQCRQTD